jgi:hypothetical protein
VAGRTRPVTALDDLMPFATAAEPVVASSSFATASSVLSALYHRFNEVRLARLGPVLGRVVGRGAAPLAPVLARPHLPAHPPTKQHPPSSEEKKKGPTASSAKHTPHQEIT